MAGVKMAMNKSHMAMAVVGVMMAMNNSRTTMAVAGVMMHDDGGGFDDNGDDARQWRRV
jgi:hypothetical protein